jgi:hypothetical protein
MRPRMAKRFHSQGYGRHTKEEVYGIGMGDLTSLNDIIGTNKFLFGDNACDVDAAVFGQLAQIVFHDQGPLNNYIFGNIYYLIPFQM